MPIRIPRDTPLTRLLIHVEVLDAAGRDIGEGLKIVTIRMVRRHLADRFRAEHR